MNACYEFTRVERPLAELDKGSPIERLFGMTDIDFIEDVLDNTQVSESPRETTKTNNPDLGAKWPLAVFYKRLCEWCYEVYDTRLTPALGQTPREAYETCMLLSDGRLSPMIRYEEAFLAMTQPMVRKAKINPSRGVKALGGFYWSEAFDSPVLENAEVLIRYGPVDTSHVFAFARGQWLKCKRLRWIPVLD